jgi:hypothetical protein
MVETGTTQDSKEFFVLDHRSLRSLSVAALKRRADKEEFLREEASVKEFLEMLGFYTRGSTVGSKVFEKVEGSSTERLWIEVYNAEGLYTLVFALSTRNVAKVKELASMLNKVLEDLAEKNGYKRVV